MSTKTKENLTVVSQEEIGKDIFSLWLQTDQMAQYARPGQFLSLYTGNAGKLLPRLSDRRWYRYSANAGDCKTVKCTENSCSRLQR